MKENEIFMADGNRLNTELVEQGLESDLQQQVRSLIRELPEEHVSLAWRSSLNEKLVATAGIQRRRQRLAWIWRPAAGLALAGSLAVAVMWKTPDAEPRPAAPAGNLEASLLATHSENSRYLDVVGVSLSPTEVIAGRNSNATPISDWNEVDLEPL